ncbi:MAG: epoxyqueuosine reductase [Desulfomonile tiedjei]|uniref:Epoxyqueuosine reductase n=1 Tax=Desulfomonile tiedjei TaxID=2358 RepID=A0A9D6V2F6_9BACT|nr:epoxyqueuosine reductase [Desulfomonile tiedjei]
MTWRRFTFPHASACLAKHSLNYRSPRFQFVKFFDRTSLVPVVGTARRLKVDAVELKSLACGYGADFVGIVDLASLRGIRTEPADLLSGYKRAISIGIRLSDGVIDPIVDSPTPLYQQHYLRVNDRLDDIAIRVSQYLQKSGTKALPIPASQLLDMKNWTSYISHKAVAIAAGIGWQGKSLLVVNPECGPRLRLVTVLTDADLEPDKPIKNRCGKCLACAEACPATAIKGENTDSHFKDRDEALYFQRCVDKVVGDFAKRPFIEKPICGVCIRACPWGVKKRKSKPRIGTGKGK